MRCDLVAEDRLRRNVVGALLWALDAHPDGCLEAALWHGVEACVVPGVIFDEAVSSMVYEGWARRAFGRLHAGRGKAERIQLGDRPSRMTQDANDK